MRLITVGMVLLLTGTVHAAPLTQAQTVALPLPDWLAGASIGAVALYLIMRIINAINAGKAPTGVHDVLVKLTDNQAEAIKLDRERFEAQQMDDQKRNENISELMRMYREDHQRMQVNEANTARLVGDIAAADTKLSGSLDTMNSEDARHNKEIESRLTEIERAMAEVQQDLASVKKSVGPNTAEQLGTVEVAFRRLTDEFHALVKALAEKPAETKTEAKHESITTVTTTTPAAHDGGAGTGRAVDPANPDGGGAGHSLTGGVERGDAHPVVEPASGTDGPSAG